MADQIPFGVVEHILTNLGSSAFQEIGSMYGVPKEMTKLKGKLGIIKAVLLDAEEKQQQSNHAVKDWVKDWVRSLKGVVYDADDLLDDYATHYLQRGGLARQVSDFFSSENQVAFRLNMSHRLKDIKERIDDIEKGIPMLNLTPRDIVHRRDSHSFVLPSEMVGREENKEEIIGKLLSSKGEEKLSVVAIVGIGGLGKTTLAKLVYNDERVVNHFEFKIWACISDDSGDSFDVIMWIKKILKSLNVGDAESLETMKTKLHEKISQKRYLLVLDDVWNQNPQKWDDVRTLLMVGAIGSKIVVTTRKPRVASIMGDNSPISLEEFASRNSRNWRRNCKNNVLGVLKLSYDNLPTHLRQCFTYCALFPKDFEIEKKLVVQLWIAQGYIQPYNNKQLEDIGDQYVEELLSRSLNHKIGGLSELKGLNQLRGGLCIRNLQNVRDVELVSRGGILKGKQCLQSLRLKWIRSGQDGGDEGDKSVMEGLQPHRHLKDIFIQGYEGTEFPSWMMNDELGSLFPYLIKIEISGCSRCKILPPFSQLPSLKSLKLKFMEELVELKEGSLTTPLFPSLESLELHVMPKLKELWRMDLLAEEDDMISLPKELLQHVSGLVTLRIRECPNLQSLELPSSPSLSELRIINCPNLASFNVASLPRLEELSLRGVRAEVLRQFMFVSASSSLKSLCIREIDGMISLREEPLQYVSTLETLHIVKCSGLATLLHWMGSLSSLTELIIFGCSELKSLPEEIYSLKKLQTFYFCDYPDLEERYKETGEDRAKIAHIPHVSFYSDSIMYSKVGPKSLTFLPIFII
ncbi:unnamed protein product, partial [Vitis vinifera]